MGSAPLPLRPSVALADAAPLSSLDPDDLIPSSPRVSFSTKFIASALVGGAALHWLRGSLGSLLSSHPLLGVLCVLVLIALALLAIRPNATHYKHSASLEGKVFVVTGANKGLGLSTSIQLARLGAHVILACRNVVRAQAAVEEISRQVPNAMVEYSECDLSSFASVRRCVSAWRDRKLEVHYLVNNAGAMLAPATTEDGHDVTWQTNYIGPALLTRLCVETDVLASEGRVVFVSSLMHYYGEVKLNEMGSSSSKNSRASANTGGASATPQLLSSTDTYCNTKLAQVMFARHLQRTHTFGGGAKKTSETGGVGAGVAAGRTTVSLNPGIIESDFFLHFIPAWCRDICTALGIFKIFSVTPEVAACTVVHACLCPGYAKSGGLYMDNCRPKLPSDQARDALACEALFQQTVEATEPGTFAAAWKHHAPTNDSPSSSSSRREPMLRTTGEARTRFMRQPVSPNKYGGGVNVGSARSRGSNSHVRTL